MAPLVTLPNGLELHAPSAVEARIIHHEIFEQEAYFKHGVSVEHGDCVFDVGANAGFFSVFLGRRYQGLRVLAFEPMPPVFALLEQNVRDHLSGVDMTLFCFGLGARQATLPFRYDPNQTFNSTAAAGDLEASVRRDAGIFDWARALVADGGRVGQLSPVLTRRLLRLLEVRGLRLVTILALGTIAVPSELWRRLRQRTIQCEVRRLSDVVRDERVERIDLLKIDVEGAEWDVLQGVDDCDWPKIRQLVVEVHDVDGRVARVNELLVKQGFSVTIDREDWALHELLGICTVFARRTD